LSRPRLARLARPRVAVTAGLLSAALSACAPHLSHTDGNGPDGSGVGGSPIAGAVGAPDAGVASARKNARKLPAPAARVPAEPGPPVEMVTIHVLADPPQRARVVWGAKDFGLAPLDIHRPRGSGPLDLMLSAPGFLTLHTRAFTDRDNTLSVHLVPESEASRFPGYQSPAPTVKGKAAPTSPSRHGGARAARPD